MNKHNQTPIWRASAPVPRHVAIIMDGNGRWAESRGLPRSAGHHKGVEAVRRTVRAAMELGVQYLTIFSFSSENWSRPAAEIDDLMGLMKRFIRRDLAELHQLEVVDRCARNFRRGADVRDLFFDQPRERAAVDVIHASSSARCDGQKPRLRGGTRQGKGQKAKGKGK